MENGAKCFAAVAADADAADAVVAVDVVETNCWIALLAWLDAHPVPFCGRLALVKLPICWLNNS